MKDRFARLKSEKVNDRFVGANGSNRASYPNVEKLRLGAKSNHSGCDKIADVVAVS